MKTNLSCFKSGLRDGIPIFLGYLAVSFTLGIVAKNIGMTAFQATLMSLTNSTSAGEFAAVTLIGAEAAYIEMAVTQFIINLRYMLMSCSLSQKLPPSVPIRLRLLMGIAVTDEIFGVSMGFPGKLNPFYTLGLICIAVPGWSFGTFLGVVSGTILPAPVITALSVALYGMFLSIIIPEAKKSKVIGGIVLISMLASFLFSRLPILKDISAGMRIIILTVIIAGAAAVLFPVKEDNDIPETPAPENSVPEK
ncbi:MAG: AzlC family ABC transporter permease [Eubacterium sp.]|nr:AzlC family ABC transporter permease [Eubacterium sp.]